MADIRDDFCVALWKLLKTQHIDDISIVDIVKTSGRSRASFYRHYESKYDLAWEALRYNFTSLARPFLSLKPYTFKSLIGLLLDSSQAARNELLHLLSSLDPQAPRRRLIDAVVKSVQNRIDLGQPLKAEDEKPSDFAHVARIYANSMVVMFVDWLSGNIRLTADEMQKAYCHWFSFLSNIKDREPSTSSPQPNVLYEPVYKATFELLAHSRIDDIYTSDIIKCSGLGRSEFYKHFEDKYDVVNRYIADCADRCFRKAIHKHTVIVFTREAIKDFLECLLDKRVELRNAFESQDRSSLRAFAIEYFTRLIVEYEKARSSSNHNGIEHVVRMFVIGTVGHVGFWLLKPQQSIDEVIDTFMMLYSAMIVFENEN